MTHILIVDDEPSICWSLEKLLQLEGYSTEVAATAESGIELAGKRAPDVILLDVRLPGISGLDSIARFQELLGKVPIILMTAFGDLGTAVAAYQKEVAEYLTKPFDLDDALALVRSTLEVSKAPAPREQPAVVRSVDSLHEIVGHSSSMQEVFKRIAMAAASDLPVLITGESGTGKELVAAAIHAYGIRKSKPYVPVALPAFNPSLIESELFGHVRGAFTGATEKREGLFEIASGGTVLLDEIGDLPMAQQVKLLRVLEQGHFTPVGDVRPKTCDVRILAATHQDLRSKIQAGEFREDLFYRLAVFEIHLPALRDRLEDLPLLCDYLLKRIGYPNAGLAVAEETLKELRSRPWRGNVRELRNALEHAALVARGQAILPRHLPPIQSLGTITATDGSGLVESVGDWIRRQLAEAPEESVEGIYEKFLREVEPVLLQASLEATGGNRVMASQRLGIHRATLREKLRKYGLDDRSE